MSKNSNLVITIAIVIATAFILPTPLSDKVFAKGDPQNGFGQGASDLGKSGEMGKHASNPDPSDSDHDTPREGIGNVAKEHNCSVGELGKALSGKDSSCQ